MPCLRKAYTPDGARAETGGLTMGECIEREAVLRAVQGQRSPCRSPAQNRMLDCLKAAVIRISAADVAPVVRCENCAFSQSDGWVCGGTALMPPHQTFPDSFCECGAKMDGGADHEAD